jgi:hypothetical protein
MWLSSGISYVINCFAVLSYCGRLLLKQTKNLTVKINSHAIMSKQTIKLDMIYLKMVMYENKLIKYENDAIITHPFKKDALTNSMKLSPS